MADLQPAGKVEELDQLMRHMEAEMAALKRATDAGEPKRSDAPGEPSLEQRVLYIEELMADLFRLMRDWNKEEPPIETHRGAADGLAIVVGHEEEKPGATALAPPFSRDGEGHYEYHWNKELAHWMVEECKVAGIRSAIFYRDGTTVPGAYRKVKAWRPKATIELHFNSAGETARGTETLFGAAESRAFATLVQEEQVKLYGRTGRHNRGLLDRSDGGRGFQNVSQIHPSALIEPFFGSNLEDCQLAQSKKRGLARCLVRAYARFVGLPFPEDSPEPKPAPAPAAEPAPKPMETPPPVPEAVVAGGPGPGPAPAPKPVVAPEPAPSAAPEPNPAPAPAVAAVVAKPESPGPAVVAGLPPVAALAAQLAKTVAAKPERFSDVFWLLTQRYRAINIDHPHLRGVTLAQWALESGYGQSALAKEHLNFAGMKWREVMKPYATPVSYEAHDGREDYCKFATVDDFIKGFWARLDLMKPYAGWRDHADSPESFIKFIAEIWAPKQNYEVKVLDLYRRMGEQGLIPTDLVA